jgi:hypothetical protein
VPNKDQKDIVNSDSAHNGLITGLGPELREIIAQAIHEAYRQVRRSKKYSRDLSTAPWDKLPNYLKESNRRQADHIFAKLHRIGGTVHKVLHRDTVRITFTKDEIEAMAEMEHARWRNERLLDEWRWGEKKDATSKVSPYLVSWSELPDEVKEWDRQAVRNMPELLAKVGFEIRRGRQKADSLASSRGD